ncbi:hypothetical protein L227DRAFT_580748 [Lentinus tigrinus ALCF2SS1-6]|uniref:Vacuolar protein sorting-associated protein 13 second N-terminal domain-containing protein n=1 Tax=Lentinus tigrinus ALCF2SS1-6 TaxID=1328759 RepID=A0A5C2RVF7_9APHY|nr:hypothetical protein L227DRAFT_580748 [Lentinus tigrinus ALCF2SS1-6]
MPLFGKHKDTSPPEEPSSPAACEGQTAPPTIAFPQPTLSGDNDDLTTAKKLDDAFRSVGDAKQGFHKYEDSKSRKFLNKSGDAVNLLQTNVTTAQSYSSPMKTVYESDAMKVVREGVNTLIDNLPGLIKALDEVAKLHPFIGIAVGAFRVVVELDIKRRDNDKKIGVLFAEMKDMMEALLQLRSIKDEEAIGPDGLTIKARMQELVKQAADEIKSCANACDTYSKKKLIVKVIKGSVWDGTLKGFIDAFANRRKAFTFALSIHIGVGVDDANRKLKLIDAKIDIVLEFFAKAVTPEQQELAALVQKKGGPTAVMGDNDTLKELLKFKPASTTITKRDGAEHKAHEGGGDDLSIVKEELFDSPELAIRKNLDIFERKFKMQQRELTEEVKRVIHHEGDRVIEAVTSGPHERIIDPDIHAIWKEMRWPGHVKARHFVLALRDFYREQLEIKKRKIHGVEEAASRLNDQDEWALEYISLARLQAISEAVDDDASGFVTIAEVNQFTTSRPKDFSLPQWIAYWAVGWHMTSQDYRAKIVDIFAKMFSMRPLIHPANRNAVDQYLRAVWRKICTLTSSLVTTTYPDSLRDRFSTYVESEEQRLREGLETVKYDIDAMDTLSLIMGPGRVEKTLFPLLYLLLRRDFEIFRVCRTRMIHKDELWDASDTILYVLDAVINRYNDLLVTFKQQKVDPANQFKVHASELFDYWHDDEDFWSLKNLRTYEFKELDYNDEEEDQNVDVGKLLNYPAADDDLYVVPNDVLTEGDAQADEAVRLILGRWHGFQAASTRFPMGTMITFCLHASADHGSYEAGAVGAHGTAFTVLGGYRTKEDGTIEYSFTRTYAARIKKSYFVGTLDEDGVTLSGKWGYSLEKMDTAFWFKRGVAPEILVARPPPAEFEENKIRALWNYALTYSLDEARRRLYSWSYFKERRDMRTEYLELLEREVDDLSTEEDIARFAYLDRKSTYDDVRCYYILQNYRQRPKPAHFDIYCDNCGDHIYGTRVVCMECGTRFTFDFCEKPACVSSEIKSRDDVEAPHLPTHDLLKIRTNILHHREIGTVLRNATEGLKRAKTLLERAAKGAEEDEASESGSGSDEEHKDGEASGQSPTTPSSPKLAHRDFSDPSDSDSEAEVPVLTCVSCSETIAQPCWYCIDCPEDANIFVCQSCDEKGGVTVGDHLGTHTLVRCLEPPAEEDSDEEQDSTDDRVAALETQISALTSQMSRIEKLLQSLVGGRTAELVVDGEA